jgi:hypothetical protein
MSTGSYSHEECSSRFQCSETETERILVNDTGDIIRDNRHVCLRLFSDLDLKIPERNLKTA